MKKFFKTFCITLLALILIGATRNLFAKGEEIFVVIDGGDKVKFDDNTGIPFAEDGRTLVPLRKTMEDLGVYVEWNQEDKQAELYLDDNTVIVPLDVNYIYVNDNKVEIDKEAKVVNERIYLPIRFVCEGFGFIVDWNQDEYIVEIYSSIEKKEQIETIDEDEIVPENLEGSNAEIIKGVTDVNIRTSKNGQVVARVSYPQRLIVIRKTGSWYEIEFEGEKRFITANSDYVKIDDGVEIETEVFDFGKMVTWDDVTVDTKGTRWKYAIQNSDNINEEIYYVGKEYGIDPVLIKLICAWESNGHLIEAYSEPYYGLMQVHKGNVGMQGLTHKDLNLMLTDVIYSLEAGCDMLLIHSNYGQKSIYETMPHYGGTYRNQSNLFYQLYEQLSGRSIYDSIFIDVKLEHEEENIEENSDDEIADVGENEIEEKETTEEKIINEDIISKEENNSEETKEDDDIE